MVQMVNSSSSTSDGEEDVGGREHGEGGGERARPTTPPILPQDEQVLRQFDEDMAKAVREEGVQTLPDSMRAAIRKLAGNVLLTLRQSQQQQQAPQQQ